MYNKAKFQEARASLRKEFTDWAIKNLSMRPSKNMFKKIFGSSVYTPHQGEQEKARRLRQLASGILKEDVLYVRR